MRTRLLNFTAFPGLLVALIGLGVTWSHDPTSRHQGLSNPDINDWTALYTEIVESEDYIVPLSYFLGFSERYTEARGEAVIDFSAGQVSVRVQGLPVLAGSAQYEVLLVDNKAGPNNSVALDAGPGGDDVITLGFLDVQGRVATLSKNLHVERLDHFEVDMAIVRRVGPSESNAFVIGGLTSLYNKWNRKLRSKSARVEGYRNVVTSIFAVPIAEASPDITNASQSAAQGQQLFFNETFDGNGRTCGTCHRADNSLTIDPDLISTLPNDDLLFVAELNPALANLENTTLLRGPRGLILENIDGFDNPPVFRAPPPLINLSFTGPFGLSGDFATISQFTASAVMQHFTKNVGGDPDSITRIAGQDFRLPT